MVIQQLLAEAGATGVGHGLEPVDARGVEAQADWDDLRSPENYTGYERTENFASPGGVLPDEPHHYGIPAKLGLNDWALAGDWTMGRNATTSNGPGGQIACRFQARDLNLVMGPTMRGASARFQVLLDGQPLGAAHGVDVDEQGHGTVAQQRLHQLIRQPGPVIERTAQITFLEPGVEACSFTFG
jgi:hypothetical protein